MAVPSLVNTHFTIANDHKLVIMVAASVAANDIMKKNRLSFTQLLQPYGAEFYKLPGMQGIVRAHLSFRVVTACQS